MPDAFDAAVIARDENGKVEVVKKHEQPTRHGAAHGLGWGLAVGAVCAGAPGRRAGGALAVGGGAGATIGAVTGHMKGGNGTMMNLKALGDVLDQGQAGLIVVYARHGTHEIAANIKAANKHISGDRRQRRRSLVRQLTAVEAGS